MGAFLLVELTANELHHLMGEKKQGGLLCSSQFRAVDVPPLLWDVRCDAATLL